MEKIFSFLPIAFALIAISCIMVYSPLSKDKQQELDGKVFSAMLVMITVLSAFFILFLQKREEISKVVSSFDEKKKETIEHFFETVQPEHRLGSKAYSDLADSLTEIEYLQGKCMLLQQTTYPILILLMSLILTIFFSQFQLLSILALIYSIHQMFLILVIIVSQKLFIHK
ncbi:Uncharacterised protein [uncultured archaeon]|nr:Uncharacterised protein [uncultured archaeon]